MDGVVHGHSHGRLPGIGNSTEVGVDCWNYAPVNLEQLRERLATQPKFQAGQEAYDDA